eukprot:15305472-Alexandrium_andersonii.AAC.1
MSASLVGSEMCIRDSPRTPPSEPHRKPPQNPFRSRSKPPQRLGLAAFSCLLYTSDAADDM